MAEAEENTGISDQPGADEWWRTPRNVSLSAVGLSRNSPAGLLEEGEMAGWRVNKQGTNPEPTTKKQNIKPPAQRWRRARNEHER